MIMFVSRWARHAASVPALALTLSLAGTAHGQMVSPVPVNAQPVVDARSLVQRAGQPVALNAGIGRVVQLPRAATSVFAADPAVAEVRAASPTTLFILGTGPGRTTVAALDSAGVPIAQFEVTVRPSAYGAGEAAAAIARALPGRRVRVEQRGDGLALYGEVANANEAEQAVRIARGYVGSSGTTPPGGAAATNTAISPTGGVENRLTILGQTQVTLRVRIAEVSRQVTRQLGIDWTNVGTIGRLAIGATTATGFGSTTANLIRGTFAGNGFNLDALISALAEDQLARVLAEPTLTAMSGESASFLVGGEFPIPVAGGGTTNNTVTVTYRSYGISLAFVPTVLSQGRILLRVRPEVSEISDVGSFTISNGSTSTSTTVPGLTIRRAETTVEVGSGQSFAIAGLLSDTSRRSSRALPWLGEIPILGALLRSDRYQRNETELVIIITPYLVRPVSDPNALREPTASAPIPDDVDRYLLLRQVARTRGRPPNMPGEAGFSLP
ncbi:type II and III secretion system protein family protein [Plastoroseomonas arctica]|uniref:Type II and III secretion system protein family protein n=1 Tax=Plastoroseomonas arctica TaxID=1509237 RepID=A0AAF1K0E6_9PROT|nr:type II and III secretion system protein family protein [Plastoroseomonas arctica]MBR0653945.1 type II and III secretion system protein family protein [Plastoroseomonas arctica]